MLFTMMTAFASPAQVSTTEYVTEFDLATTLSYCSDTTVSVVDSSAKPLAPMSAKPDPTWVVPFDTHPTADTLIARAIQAVLAMPNPREIPVYHPSADRYTLGGTPAPGTAGLPKWAVTCELSLHTGSVYNLKKELDVTPGCKDLREALFAPHAQLGVLEGVWTGPTGSVRFERAVEEMARQNGFAYTTGCAMDDFDGLICGLGLFKTREWQAIGKKHVEASMSALGQSANPCPSAAF